MLFIEIGSRLSYYRVNGQLVASSAQGIEIGIREAYPNCPKFIQRRKLLDMGTRDALAAPVTRGTLLEGAVADLVRQADTLFVASVHPERGADASHRGGRPGFVTMRDAATLRIPDYQGNSMFNTLGNFSVDPHA
ncbi:pyridoxamine 5'-phosphate oxidase family protein [Massilia sp. B-10]|nr:pyridoxamine 5'-phosphate oxidase family protein [Massilia sp. B-10]